VTILLIDDDQIGTGVRAQLLTLHGYQVFCATDGLQGLAILKAEHIDLVIVDYLMPNMTGDKVLEEIHYIRPTLPTLILTGSMFPDDSREHWKVQPTEYMVKGEGAQRLLEIVTRLVPIPEPTVSLPA
jgi:DNA-binding NtrC family response regulator